MLRKLWLAPFTFGLWVLHLPAIVLFGDDQTGPRLTQPPTLG